jgi:tRNA (guanine-N7-)-methyltransferase
MGQNKLLRFQEIKTFGNVLDHPENMKGRWKSFFKNAHPITLELACGKGEYAVGLGRMYQNRNFIGIDIKGNRIWKGAKTALDEGLDNVAFLRAQIDKLTDFFEEGEVNEIWITFPDPQLRGTKIKKRLTHPKFLRLYRKVMQNEKVVNLKTDSPELYEFTKAVIHFYDLELVHDDDHIYNSDEVQKELAIKTYYESLDIAKSKKVHYLRFRITKDLPLEKDEILKSMLSEQRVD